MAVSVYACGLLAPRQLTAAQVAGVGDVLFVGTRKWRTNTSIYAIVDDEPADGIADRILTIDSGLDQPNGVEWWEGALYVATARALLRYDDVVDALRGATEYTVRTVLNPTAFPELGGLQWHYLRANASGTLYASISAGCDHCVPSEPLAASIVTLDAAQCYAPRVFARGVRFSVGFTFDAAGALVFTNNAHDSTEVRHARAPLARAPLARGLLAHAPRSMRSDARGTCPVRAPQGDDAWDTIQRAPAAGLDFGYPHCYVDADGTLAATSNADVAVGSSASGYSSSTSGACAGYSAGTALGDHLAPLGVAFRNATTLLVAERGAFQGPPTGHRVSAIRADLTGYHPLISGFINTSSGVSWGRPVDVQMAPTGGDAFFVSDDKSNSIFRFATS